MWLVPETVDFKISLLRMRLSKTKWASAGELTEKCPVKTWTNMAVILKVICETDSSCLTHGKCLQSFS